MGVPFKIVLYTAEAATARNAAEAAFRRVEELNAKLSDYETDSELNELSRTSGSGRAIAVSEDLWRVLKMSQKLAERTRGAFDITVGPSVNLWRRARRMKQLPDAQALADASGRVGFEKMILDHRQRRVRLTAPDMKLDLGGIAKGYAVDEAMRVLQGRGIRRALVAASGDILVSEAPPGAGGWRIGLVDLDESVPRPTEFLSLRHGAVSTSGDLSQRLEIGGVRYSHIVDPRTGVGLTNHTLVTVIARTCTESDSIATAVSVLGPDEGLRFAKGVRGAEVRILRPSSSDRGESMESAGFARRKSEVELRTGRQNNE